MATKETAAVEQAKEERMTPDTETRVIPKPRYHLHAGANGMHTVMRRVDCACSDFSEGMPEGLVDEYYDNVCICASAYVALAVATALQDKYPDGNIT